MQSSKFLMEQQDYAGAIKMGNCNKRQKQH